MRHRAALPISLLVPLLAPLSSLVSAQITTQQLQDQCDCGFVDLEDPTGSVWTDLFEYNFIGLTGPLLDKNVWNEGSTTVAAKDSQFPGRGYQTNNVVLTDRGMELLVQPESDTTQFIPSSEVISKSFDFGYGSYHAVMQFTNVGGTVGSFFTYLNATEEVDVELVSDRSPTINFAVKPQIYDDKGNPSPLTLATDPLGFDPSAALHHYSFVWVPEIVHFGVDGVYNTNITVNVPSARAAIVLAHWSDGSPTFSGGPPASPASMLVTQVWAFYNASTSSGTFACQKSTLPCTRGTTFPFDNVTAADAFNPPFDTAVPATTTQSAILALQVSTSTPPVKASPTGKKPSGSGSKSAAVMTGAASATVLFGLASALLGLALL